MCVGLMLGVVLAFIDSLLSFSWAHAVAASLRVATAGFVGAVSGFFGGLIGGAITRSLSYLPLQIAGTILGWTITGLLIGASVGVFDLLVAVARERDVGGSLRKVVHGLSGGAIGGLLGSLLYLLFYGVLGGVFGDKVDLDKMWTPAPRGSLPSACASASWSDWRR